MRTRSALTSVAVMTALGLSGCSDADGGRAAATMEGTSRLEAALAVAADDEASRSRFAFADTTRIRDLYSVDNRDNMIAALGDLVAGAEFADDRSNGPDRLGLAMPSADYVVSVGDPKTGHSALIGGQDQQSVADLAGNAGWEERDGEWLALPYDEAVAVTEDRAVTQRLNGALPRIVAEGENIAISRTASDATLPGVMFTGPSLADNPRAAALANCLGDVVAASIRTDLTSADGRLIGVAAGISTPKDSQDLTAHHVVCAMWEDDDSATAYEEAVVADIESDWGRIADGEPIVGRVDGPDLTVRWELDGRTASAAIGIENLDNGDALPGLPGCVEGDGGDREGCLPVVPAVEA